MKKELDRKVQQMSDMKKNQQVVQEQQGWKKEIEEMKVELDKKTKQLSGIKVEFDRNINMLSDSKIQLDKKTKQLSKMKNKVKQYDLVCKQSQQKEYYIDDLKREINQYK